MFENDHYRYIWEGKVVAGGKNPYKLPPKSKALDDIEYSKRDLIGYPKLASIYPPIALGLFSLVSPFDHELALVFLQIIFFLILLFIIPYWFKESDKYFLLILPLLGKEFVQSVHIDLIGVLFFTLALKEKKALKKHSYLILSFFTKILSVVAIPYLFFKDKKKNYFYFLIPFLLALMFFLRTTGAESFVKYWYWNSIPMDFLLLLKLDFQTSRIILLILFFIFSLIALLKRKSLSFIYGVLFLFSPVVHPWYLLWLFPFLKNKPSYALYVFSSVVAYMPYGLESYKTYGSFLSFLILLYCLIKDYKKGDLLRE